MANEEPGYRPPDVALVGGEHVRRYRETNGEVGYLWNGVPILLLTTRGQRTGQARTSALIFGRDGDDLLVIASKGGSPTHPAWYGNLLADPSVTVQVQDKVFPARAANASGSEKSRLWRIMAEQWPNYDVYTTRTDRDIPLVVLTPVAPPM